MLGASILRGKVCEWFFGVSGPGLLSVHSVGVGLLRSQSKGAYHVRGPRAGCWPSFPDGRVLVVALSLSPKVGSAALFVPGRGRSHSFVGLPVWLVFGGFCGRFSF